MPTHLLTWPNSPNRMRIEINMDVEDIDEGPLADELGEEEHEDVDEEYSDDLLDDLTDSDDSEDMWPLESASDEELNAAIADVR